MWDKPGERGSRRTADNCNAPRRSAPRASHRRLLGLWRRDQRAADPRDHTELRHEEERDGPGRFSFSFFSFSFFSVALPVSLSLSHPPPSSLSSFSLSVEHPIPLQQQRAVIPNVTKNERVREFEKKLFEWIPCTTLLGCQRIFL